MEIRTQEQSAANPLAKHFRQPNIYLQLPSRGQFWPSTALNLPINGEVGIMPMTTRDEITLKTPDALINGQGVVDVIQSCCPAIVDAWNMPSIDVDAVLIAIRIASFGKQMDFKSKCPHCKTESEYAIDLTVLLGNIESPDYQTPKTINNLVFRFKPQPYSGVNQTSIIAFEEQQLLRSLADYGDSPDQAKAAFEQHLNKVLDLNTTLLSTSIDSITMPDGISVSKTEFIKEFLMNAETQVIKEIRSHLNSLSDVAGIKPVDVNCNNEECGRPFSISLTFDYASFFESGS